MFNKRSLLFLSCFVSCELFAPGAGFDFLEPGDRVRAVGFEAGLRAAVGELQANARPLPRGFMLSAPEGSSYGLSALPAGVPAPSGAANQFSPRGTIRQPSFVRGYLPRPVSPRRPASPRRPVSPGRRVSPRPAPVGQEIPVDEFFDQQDLRSPKARVVRVASLLGREVPFSQECKLCFETKRSN